MNSVLMDRRAIVVLLGPALLIYTVVMLIPIGWSVGYAFLQGNTFTGFSWVGLANFAKFFSDPEAGAALSFTLRYAVILTIGQVAAGYGLALLYTFVLRKMSGFVRSALFFPTVLPTVSVALLFQKLFASSPTDGPVNSVLQAVGLHSVDWFGQPGAAFGVIILLDIWRSMGFYAVLLYTGIIDIPEDLFEAARIDGAGTFRVIRSIVLPLSLPILLASAVFSANGALKGFDLMLALTNGGPGSATTPLTLYMFNTSFTYADYGYGSTIAIMLTILCLVVTVAIFQSSRRDLTRDAKS